MENIKCKDAENGTHDDTQNDTEIIKIIEDIIENGCNDNIISRLDKVYKNNYRHKYSQILKFLIDLPDESLDYLLLNLEHLKQHILSEGRDFDKSFLKLYDHINLEATRIRIYHGYKERADLIENKVNQAKEEIKKYDKLKEEFGNIDKQVKGLNVQSISILGIFSGVVVTFFGGLKITTSVFSNLSSNIGKFRIVFMTSLVGMILFNTVNLLLSFLNKISNYNNNYSTDQKVKNSLLFWFNLFMISIMVLSTALWFIAKKWNIFL